MVSGVVSSFIGAGPRGRRNGSCLQVAVHEVYLLQPAKALADVLRTDLPDAVHRFELGVGRGKDLVQPAELADDVLHHEPRQPGDPAEDAVAAGGDGIVERVDLAVVARDLGQAAEVQQVLVRQPGDAVERDRERLVVGDREVVVEQRRLVRRDADHGLLELHLDQPALGAELDDVALDLDRHPRDQLGALEHREDVVQRDAALELERGEAGGDLVEPAAVLVERSQRLVGLGEHRRDLLEDVLRAVDVERDDVAALGDGDHQRVGLLRDPLGRAVARAGLRGQDGRVRHQLDVAPRDLGRVRVQRDRAVHLRQLVEQRGRVVDVELDPAAEEERELVGIADDDQAAGARVDDVVDAFANCGARCHHLQGLDQSGLLTRFELCELFPGSRRHQYMILAAYLVPIYPLLWLYRAENGGLSKRFERATATAAATRAGARHARSGGAAKRSRAARSTRQRSAPRTAHRHDPDAPAIALRHDPEARANGASNEPRQAARGSCSRPAVSDAFSAARSVGASVAPRPAPAGAIAGVRPNFAASASRRSGWATLRSSPVRPISPKQAIGRTPAPATTPRAALATASAIARSAPGSSTRTPPATLTNASALPTPTLACRPRTASTSASRLRSIPLAMRRGGTSSEGETSAWTSTSSGRDPSIAASTTLPGARVASPTKRALASCTSTSPPWRISNTPASLVEPKRFFSARSVRYVRSRSPSNWSTQSTRCSSTRGPASAPSFVTWPTSSTAMSRAFASRVIRSATSRTCPTDPAAPVRSVACSVCTESTTQTSGRSASSVASTVSRSVSASTGTSSAAPGSRAARSLICAADSSPETYSVRRPAPARFPSAIDVSVDLPIPGEPPRSTSEPGTSPPPSTRSSSAMPVVRRATATALTSARRTGRAALPGVAARRAGAGCSSTSVFHSPQPRQRPCHFRASWPQAEQVKTVRAMGSLKVGAEPDRFAPGGALGERRRRCRLRFDTANAPVPPSTQPWSAESVAPRRW